MLQDGHQAVVLLTDLGVSQLPFTKADQHPLVGRFHDQRTCFVSQVDQVEQLGDCEIAQVALECHNALITFIF